MKMLLIDTCAATGGVALAEGDAVVATALLPERTASAEVIVAVRGLLGEVGWGLDELQGVAVVSGPGSFTGVRVGLAAAKGLCETLGVPMAAVSRLEVLAETAGLRDGFAVMDAGRGEVFVRKQGIGNREQGTGGVESLVSVEDFVVMVGGLEVVICEVGLMEKLAAESPRLVELGVGDCLAAVRRGFAVGGVDVALVDANYVRGEAQIYGKKV